MFLQALAANVLAVAITFWNQTSASINPACLDAGSSALTVRGIVWAIDNARSTSPQCTVVRGSHFPGDQTFVPVSDGQWVFISLAGGYSALRIGSTDGYVHALRLAMATSYLDQLRDDEVFIVFAGLLRSLGIPGLSSLPLGISGTSFFADARWRNARTT
jgi:hypothetical protein